MLLAIGAVVLVVLLSTSIGGMQFQPGHPIAHGDSMIIQISVEKISSQINEIPFWKMILFWGLVFLLIVIIASLFSPELRKKILFYFFRLSLFGLALFYIIKNFHQLFPDFSLDGLAAASAGSLTGGESSAPMVFTPPHMSPTTLYLVSLLFVVAMGVLAVLTKNWWSKALKRTESSKTINEIANVAQTTIEEISNGTYWGQAIIECYSRMSGAISLRRGVIRRKDLTAREFAIRLSEIGLPAEPVSRLTQLFEMARYGGRKGNPDEVNDAIACLNNILQACGASS